MASDKDPQSANMPRKQHRPTRRHEQETFDLGQPKVDLTKANQIAADLENDEVVEKMKRGK
ncbi:MAG TPA: hypothetical protein VFD37_01550 [Solirubrobacterales bacterium]|nr:hypothetical protein [Solirubrobacterales bacterium]